ncbi:hypothetical protein FGO68_gene657 [Halteria grandinella]|uniref:Uncharacterized protein n=1 Tax=Halteria grandinella TaxID=5974 RepID=A0A8J8SWR1_HALGN|nr:hypothetical protein FGO68_gene657 [Halteria grandinella]
MIFGGYFLNFGGDSLKYGFVILQETADWGKGAITEIISSQTCPPEYEAVTAQFPGTREYCGDSGDVRDKSDDYKKCKTIDGVEAANLDVIDEKSQHLCIKRDSALTYHEIVKHRDITKCKYTICGGEGEKGYCNSICPFNGVGSYIANKDSTKDMISQIYPQTNQKLNNPLVTIEFRLS